MWEEDEVASVLLQHSSVCVFELNRDGIDVTQTGATGSTVAATNMGNDGSDAGDEDL